ncbi:hypothetical protein [Georgenia subflava]|uniref:Uncharacterized protein n=1 Tax=Georgenia subflava TaxID=1622177 RepID=A0A6N7EPT2_9MICO|nr:hypothetical protein [Georgenia subflava]MPV37234.1 hypothetical protein [Georgenia subflava]
MDAVPQQENKQQEPRKLKAPASAYVKTAVLGVAVAVAIGAAAGLFRQEDFWLVAIVFAAMVLPTAVALGWFVFVSRHVVEEDAHASENVELQWWHRAGFGAMTDMLTVCGLGLFALSITGIQIGAVPVLAAVVVLGMADMAIRYFVLLRRG